MKKLILALLFVSQAFSQIDIAARRIYVGTLAGNRVNIGLDYINSLNSGLPGMTIWALGQSSNYGLLRLSNGTGAGGIDANGAQVFAQASNGSIGLEGPLLLYNPSLGSTTSKMVYNADGSLTINQGGTDRLTFSGSATEAIFRAHPVPTTTQTIGTSAARWTKGWFGTGGLDSTGPGAFVGGLYNTGSGTSAQLVLTNSILGLDSFLRVSDDGDFTINLSGTDRSVFDTGSLEWSWRGHMVPATTQTIGTSSKRWSKGWFGTGGIDSTGTGAFVGGLYNTGSGTSAQLVLTNSILGLDSFLRVSDDGDFTINLSGTDRLVFDTATLEWSVRGTPVPATTQAIGTSSKRWNKGWFGTGGIDSTGPGAFIGGVYTSGTTTDAQFVMTNNTVGATSFLRYEDDGSLTINQGGTDRLTFSGSATEAIFRAHPVPTTTQTIGTSSKRWTKGWFGALDVAGHILPATDVTYNLGDLTHRFASLFTSGIGTDSVSITNVAGSANTALSISGAFEEITVGSANSVSTIARARLVASNPATGAIAQLELDVSTKTATISGHTILLPDSLSATGLLLKDASGTTTGNSFELQTNGGTTFYKIIGGTDSGAPGTVVSRDHVPVTDNTYQHGNSTHHWATTYVNSINMNGGGGTVTTTSGGAGQNVTKTVRNSAGSGTCTLIFEQGFLIGGTC